MAGILTNQARIKLVDFIKSSDLHLAFATGSPSWDAYSAPYPAYDLAQTDVTAEFVRKKVQNVQYCTPNVSGDIVTDRGNFAISLTATNHLYLRATLEPDEYNTQVIREFGLFLGAVVQSGLPGGQLLFTPSQVVTKGSLILVRRVNAVQRTSTTRQLCEFVITI